MLPRRRYVSVPFRRKIHVTTRCRDVGGVFGSIFGAGGSWVWLDENARAWHGRVDGHVLGLSMATTSLGLPGKGDDVRY
jgi:hypothetical protein